MSDMDVLRARRVLQRSGVGPEATPGTTFPEVQKGPTRYRAIYLGTVLDGARSDRAPQPRWSVHALWSGETYWMHVADVIRDDEHPDRRWSGEDRTLWVVSGAMAQTALDLFEDVLKPGVRP